jgi:hypothetical protein
MAFAATESRETSSADSGRRRSDCHALGFLAARGGRVYRPDDAQVEPRET